MIGFVRMIRTSDSGNDGTPANWVVYKEDDSVLDTTNSPTQGLQDAMDYAAGNGFDLKVYGGGIKPQVYGSPYGGLLTTNPFGTAQGSNVVGVNHPNHGLVTGAHITFIGVPSFVNGIPKSEIEANIVVNVLNPNTYTFTTSTCASSSGSAGGTQVSFQQIGQDVAIIFSSVPIYVPPLQGVHWDIHATINFAGSQTGLPVAIDFDSLMASEITFRGQIVTNSYYGTGVRFKPRGDLPQDPNGPVMTACRIDLPSVSAAYPGAICIDLDASFGGISGNRCEFIEPNNNSGGTGIRVQAGPHSSFDGNIIRALDVHGASVCGIDSGFDPTYAHNVFGNFWHATIDPSTGSVGVKEHGRNNHWVMSITNNEGTVDTGLVIEPTARKNIFMIPQNSANTKVLDIATVHDNLIIAT